MEYGVTAYGERRRVHREYVDVVARIGRDGSIEPVVVLWKDGRVFRVDEVTDVGGFGAPERGRSTAVYGVRFGRHETTIYLERAEPRPALQQPGSLRWWVWAYDATRPGTAADGA